MFASLLILFATAFIAATFLPAQSELLLLGLLLEGEHSPLLLVAVATCGNVLGSCLNWWLGKHVRRFQHRRWFPISEASLNKATQLFQRWGLWSLLFAWLPFIGDPLTFAAGLLRAPLRWFIPLVTIGKCARYSVLAILAY